MRVALAGNVTALIFLGKTLLGLSEKTIVEAHVAPKPAQPMTEEQVRARSLNYNRKCLSIWPRINRARLPLNDADAQRRRWTPCWL